jgi:hypothetical protein
MHFINEQAGNSSSGKLTGADLSLRTRAEPYGKNMPSAITHNNNIMHWI